MEDEIGWDDCDPVASCRLCGARCKGDSVYDALAARDLHELRCQAREAVKQARRDEMKQPLQVRPEVLEKLMRFRPLYWIGPDGARHPVKPQADS